MEKQHIGYDIISLVADVCLKDTRVPAYHTKTGKIRPRLSMCFDPEIQLVMAYSLNAEPLNQQELAALLYAAFTTSQEIPYGGLPDTITYDGIEAFTPSLQQTLERWGIHMQQGSPTRPLSGGSTERFLARLQREFWDGFSAVSTPDHLPSDAGTADFTLSEVDSLLRSYLLTSNQAICGESGDASHVAWQPAQQGEIAQLKILLEVLHSRTLTHKGIAYLRQTYWDEQFAAFAPGTSVFLRPVPAFSASAPETIDVFIRSEWICSLPVHQEQWSREIFE